MSYDEQFPADECAGCQEYERERVHLTERLAAADKHLEEVEKRFAFAEACVKERDERLAIVEKELRGAAILIESRDRVLRELNERLAAAEAREQKDITELQRRSREYIALLERLAASATEHEELIVLHQYATRLEETLTAKDAELNTERMLTQQLKTNMETAETQLATAKTDRDQYKRLWEQRGKILQKPCLKCGYTPQTIHPATRQETEYNDQPKCGLCGHPMPKGEEMFQFHGYSGPCPTEPCDHEWEIIDDSFDHEYGCEQIIYERCSKCGKEQPHDASRFDDDVI